jgi:ankyrin repeat protein
LRTPARIAAEYGHFEAIEYLAEIQADLESSSRDGMRPINVALELGHLQVVEILLRYKLDVHVADPEGHTALQQPWWARRIDI